MISPHSFTESLRAFLSEALQGIFVHTPVTNGELVLPYVLLTCTAEAERIPGNHTWECNLCISKCDFLFDFLFYFYGIFPFFHIGFQK